jgi:hypothetical protein
MKNRKRYRHEVYITDTESFEWYFIIIEVDNKNAPLNAFFVKVPPTNPNFKIYPYLFN